MRCQNPAIHAMNPLYIIKTCFKHNTKLISLISYVTYRIQLLKCHLWVWANYDIRELTFMLKTSPHKRTWGLQVFQFTIIYGLILCCHLQIFAYRQKLSGVVNSWTHTFYGEEGNISNILDERESAIGSKCERAVGCMYLCACIYL